MTPQSESGKAFAEYPPIIPAPFYDQTISSRLLERDESCGSLPVAYREWACF
jgi:hypothetical protein